MKQKLMALQSQYAIHLQETKELLVACSKDWEKNPERKYVISLHKLVHDLAASSAMFGYRGISRVACGLNQDLKHLVKGELLTDEVRLCVASKIKELVRLLIFDTECLSSGQGGIEFEPQVKYGAL